MSTRAGPSTQLSAEVEAFIDRNPIGRAPAGLDERFKWLVDFQRRLHEAEPRGRQLARPSSAVGD